MKCVVWQAFFVALVHAAAGSAEAELDVEGLPLLANVLQELQLQHYEERYA